MFIVKVGAGGRVEAWAGRTGLSEGYSLGSMTGHVWLCVCVWTRVCVCVVM